tara:strand:+ start:360 stop:953 length:594 start_codon:yes stop_codon:yes gene_type:complete
MVRNRTGLAPWSLAREAGIESATVDGRIEVPQYVQPTLNTGFVDEKGDWKGAKSSDKQFRAFQIDEGIANGGVIITPSANADGTWPLDMTGYKDIFIAIKPSNGGNCAIEAVMGPADVSYANLNPVNAAATIKIREGAHSPPDLESAFVDSAESLTADVWNIFNITAVLSNQKLLQFKITNNSGGSSDIETAFMRII